MIEAILFLVLAGSLYLQYKAGEFYALQDLFRDQGFDNRVYESVYPSGVFRIGGQTFDYKRYNGVGGGNYFNQKFWWTADFWHSMKGLENACDWLSGVLNAVAAFMFAVLFGSWWGIVIVLVFGVFWFFLSWGVFGARFIYCYHYKYPLIPKGNFFHYLKHLFILDKDPLSNVYLK